MRNIVIVCLLGLLYACAEEPDCDLGAYENSAKIKFYNSEDSTELIVRFVQVKEKGTDSVFYDSENELSRFPLNLNPTSNQVTYVFQDGISEDTLTLAYIKELRWISEECGPAFFYDGLEVIGSSFTYELTSTFIDISIDENIKIYN